MDTPTEQGGISAGTLQAYWRRNLMLVSVLLLAWAFVSFGCGILWADWLDQFRLPFTAYPLGFWFAQQGSIGVFVVLVFVYVVAMNRIERDEGMQS